MARRYRTRRTSSHPILAVIFALIFAGMLAAFTTAPGKVVGATFLFLSLIFLATLGRGSGRRHR